MGAGELIDNKISATDSADSSDTSSVHYQHKANWSLIDILFHTK